MSEEYREELMDAVRHYRASLVYQDNEDPVLEEAETSQEKLHARGKTIVLIVAIVHILGAILSAIVQFNLVTLVVQIALAIALLCGVSWVRYLFAVNAGLSYLTSFYLLFIGTDFTAIPSVIGRFLLGAYLVISMLYSVAACVVLFKSKAVSEFLYAQRTGW